jgi:TatD DNase family protein
MLVETDAPFLAPIPHRGKRNEPAWVQKTVEVLAGVKGVSAEELAERTVENTRRFFGLPPV